MESKKDLKNGIVTNAFCVWLNDSREQVKGRIRIIKKLYYDNLETDRLVFITDAGRRHEKLRKNIIDLKEDDANAEY